MRSGLVLLACALVAGGCYQSSSPPPAHVAVAIHGGTTAMRARARIILGHMGGTPITRVQFQRPPFTYSQFARDSHDDWLTVTVHAPGDLGTQPASWALGYADIFERAYQAAVPSDGYRIRGTSEQTEWNGRVHVQGSGTSGPSQWAGAARTTGDVGAVIRHAAQAQGFTVDSLQVFHPDRVAAVAVLTVATRGWKASRLNAFQSAMGKLAEASDGVQWQLRDRCGGVIASIDSGTYLNPRWECPNPWTLGAVAVGSSCPPQRRTQPAC